MLVVEDGTLIKDWIESNLKVNVGVIWLDTSTYEVSQGITQDLVIIHIDALNNANKNIIKKLEKCEGVILFNLDSRPVKNKVENIIQVIDEKINIEYFSTLVKKIESSMAERQFLKSDLLSIDRELSGIYYSLNEELHRVKDTYEKNYPRRFNEVKGIKLFGKYAAGSNMGTDYYDVIMNDENLFGIICSSNSYLFSSSIVKYFHELKEVGVIGEKEEKEFINNLISEEQKLKSSTKLNVDVLTFRINYSTLELNINSKGSFGIIISDQEHMFLNDENNQQVKQHRFNLKREDRLLLNSTGLYRHNLGEIPVSKMEEVISNKKIKSLDILDEIYFQLKKDKEDGIIDFDSSSLIVEVTPNVILSV